MYALEHNNACSDTVNKVDLDSESMPGSRCRSYDGETSVTFDLILPRLICSFYQQFSAIIERSITLKLFIGIIVRLENSFSDTSRLD